MTDFNFTDDEISRCKSAMDKPAPLACLRSIAAGELPATLSKDGRDLLIEYQGERMFVAGGWPLFRAGMIDERCRPTPLGLEMAKVAP